MTNRTQSYLQTLSLCVIAFLGNIAITTASLGFVYYFRGSYALSASAVGMATQISTCTFFLGCMTLSPVVQRLRPRVCVSLSLLGQGALLFAFASANTPLIGFLLLAVYGLFQSLLWPAVEAWITRGKEGDELTRITTGYNFSWSFGAGIASYIAGLLAELSSKAPFVFSIVTFVGLALFIALVSHLNPLMRNMTSEKKENSEGAIEDHSTPLRFPSWVGVVLVYLANTAFLNIFPMYAQEKLMVSKATTGFLLLLRGVASCFCFIWISRTSFWQFRFWFIVLTQTALALMCLIVGSFTHVWCYVPYFILFGMLYAFCYELSMFHGAAFSPDRAKRMALHETLLTFGQILGAGLGGVLYQYRSFGFCMGLYGGVTLLSLLIEIVWWSGVKRHAAAPSSGV